jgi:hypothetical protein
MIDISMVRAREKSPIPRRRAVRQSSQIFEMSVHTRTKCVCQSCREIALNAVVMMDFQFISKDACEFLQAA